MAGKVTFNVGHTHRELSYHEAKRNVRGERMVHRYSLFVEITSGSAQLVKSVRFLNRSDETPIHVCNGPSSLAEQPDGTYVHTFSTKKYFRASPLPVNVKFRLVGAGNSFVDIAYSVSFYIDRLARSPSYTVYESSFKPGVIQVERPHRITKLRTFGVELELSDSYGRSSNAIAGLIYHKTGFQTTVVDEYRNAHKSISTWKLVHDGSIQCSRTAPTCSKFELVSPILRGFAGLNECKHVLHALQSSSSVHIDVNSSMGFHVHVGVKDVTLAELKNICKNFVKYEDAIDSFMAPSRRTGGSAGLSYCKSCKDAIVNPSGTVAKLNGGRFRAIDACGSIKSLCILMNPHDRYYKLNLRNLVTGRQPTIEFRQHSATCNSAKVHAWIRFCVAFVDNSVNLPAPEYLKNGCDAHEQFDILFDNVIGDSELKRFFQARRFQLHRVKSSGRSHCCSGCSRGERCASRR